MRRLKKVILKRYSSGVDTIAYTSRGPNREVIVSGMQVGRFAVRYDKTVMLNLDNNIHFKSRGWLVDHVPSGYVIMDVYTFSDAVLIADEISRFSVADPVGTDMPSLAEQLGDELCTWLEWIESNDGVGGWDFRRWLKRTVPNDIAELARQEARANPPLWSN